MVLFEDCILETKLKGKIIKVWASCQQLMEPIWVLSPAIASEVPLDDNEEANWRTFSTEFNTCGMTTSLVLLFITQYIHLMRESGSVHTYVNKCPCQYQQKEARIEFQICFSITPWFICLKQGLILNPVLHWRAQYYGPVILCSPTQPQHLSCRHMHNCTQFLAWVLGILSWVFMLLHAETSSEPNWIDFF